MQNDYVRDNENDSQCNISTKKTQTMFCDHHLTIDF